MRHPNAFPNYRNPREVRSLMHTVYDRYVHGEDMFPRIRLAAPPEQFGRKSHAIATSLTEAWARIDEDNHFFGTALEVAVRVGVREKDPIKSSNIITKLGINAVNFAHISPNEDAPNGLGVEVGRFWVAEAIEMLNGLDLKMTDGRVVRITDGHLEADPLPDMRIIRKSGAAGVFLARQSEQVA